MSGIGGGKTGPLTDGLMKSAPSGAEERHQVPDANLRIILILFRSIEKRAEGGRG